MLALASRPDLGAVASRSDVALQLCGLLESLRGATRASLSRTQGALFALVARLLQALLVVAHAFRAHTAPVALVLKLATDVVEHHVSHLKVGGSLGAPRRVLVLAYRGSPSRALQALGISPPLPRLGHCMTPPQREVERGVDSMHAGSVFAVGFGA